MLQVDTNYYIRVGFIHDGSFHVVKEVDEESSVSLQAKPNTLCFSVDQVTYSFAKRSLKRFYWDSSSDEVTFEWDFNTGPKIHNSARRTTHNPLGLTEIECNALSFNVKPAKSGTRQRFLKLIRVIDDELPYEKQKQHQSSIPSNLPLIVGLYLETLLSMQIPKGRITSNFWRILQSVSTEKAISALMSMKETRSIILNPTQALQRELDHLDTIDLEDWPSKQQEERQKRDEAALVFQVEITPTKTYIIGPILEKSNRILRKYWKYRDHFVRVRFTDEDGSPIQASETEIGQLVHDKLLNGITLAGRNFSFLAWSNSQLRGHSCFLFTKIVNEHRVVTARDIIDQLGEFWDDSPAKRGARVGQCLTSTVGGIRISVHKCEVIDDVTRNGYIFSDGVGTASYGVMELVQKKLRLPIVPSAIQIRYRGAKGVLSLDDRLTGVSIKIRNSMIKFNSDHKELEVTGYSTYRPAYLNRQLITLLQALGTSTKSLQRLEEDMTSKIDALKEGEASEETLDQITWGHSKEMLKKTIDTFGFDDEFLQALINKHSSKALKSLINKTRILIPNSAYAMGILDEYDCLAENEIFYQGKTESGEVIKFSGEVMVTRSPAVHAGDVRVLKAVHKYDLSHLYNVVVFSSKGNRPVPNMISGGDLDGDHYTIIAEKSIFPKKTVAPMNYSSKPKLTTTGKHSWPEDAIKFFVHYIANDNLGKVANTWQAQCELQERGALSSIAVKLAHIHSTIVDFPKTGISASLPDYCKTSIYPDYMGKSPNKSFRSESFIGQSHRRLSAKYGDPFQVSDFKLELDDDLASYPGYSAWVDDAHDIYDAYSTEMQTLIKDFGALSDVDIVTGIVPPTSHKRFRGKKSNTVEKMDIAFLDLKRRYLRRFEQGTEDYQDMLAKASAWYRVVYNLSEGTPAFASFAWILADYLVDIKKANFQRLKKRNYY